MKRLILMVVMVALLFSLAGCSWLSNNSDDDTRTWSKDRTSDTDILSENDVHFLDVQVDNRTWVEVESPCPVAMEIGSRSCNVEVTP